MDRIDRLQSRCTGLRKPDFVYPRMSLDLTVSEPKVAAGEFKFKDERVMDLKVSVRYMSDAGGVDRNADAQAREAIRHALYGDAYSPLLALRSALSQADLESAKYHAMELDRVMRGEEAGGLL